MIYPNNFEEKIKFRRIRELITENCISTIGTEWVERMTFSSLYGAVTELLYQTSEFVEVITHEDMFPGIAFSDLRQPLQRIRIEGLFLEERELFDLQKSLLSAAELVRFFKTKPEDQYLHLKTLINQIVVSPEITSRIDRILNKYGEIKDNATPELARIRQQIQAQMVSINRKMAAILKQAKADGLVEDDISVSIRDGRAVIPVPSANKRKLGGIIHDESSTGKTTFIEPTAIVEINNQLRELENAQRREIVRILTEISDFIRPFLPELNLSFELLGMLDFIRAKARFAITIKACLPSVQNKPMLTWDKAVHPLLYLQHQKSGLPVVPLDIDLSEAGRILVISGPNAGGKSICLQTVGLLQYMLQCGLLVPMEPSSKMGFFEQIFIDMGDEQSLENDLSTYSSHLTNMKNFVKFSNRYTLILIDEFGTGTEPMLGGAIAESVLNQLNNQEVYGVITTHYTNLKHFAAQTPGIVNGAMLFDTHAIQPLFKLEMGKPGSSFAFEIARKIGLPESILAEAREKIGQEHFDYDRHLREIARDKRYWEQKRQSIRFNEKKLEEVLANYQSELEKVKKEKKEIIQKAKTEAGEMLKTANQKIENTIREIKESQAEKEKTRILRQQITEFKEEVETKDEAHDASIERKIRQIQDREKRKADKKIEVKKTPQPEKQPQPEEIKPIQKGDYVMLEGQTVPGQVIELEGKNAVVAFGAIKSIVKLSRLTRLSQQKFKSEIQKILVSAPGLTDQVMQKKLHFKPDIDLRGKRADEAMQLVISHIDEAIICEVSSLKILHGKGDGILRKMIRDYLSTVDLVRSFRDEHVQFGGSGITLVELDV